MDYNADEWMYIFSFHFPRFVDIISLAVNLIPYTLLVIFLGRYRDKVKMSIILAIVAGLLSVNSLISFINYISHRPVFAIFNILFVIIFALIAFGSILCKKYRNKIDTAIIMPIIFAVLAFAYIITTITYFDYYFYVIDFWNIMYLVLSVLFVLSTISVLKGLSNKIIVIITLSVGILLKTINLITFFANIGELCESARYLYLFTNPAGIIGEGVLYLVLLFYVLSNKLPVLITHIIRRKEISSPEQELRFLKEQFENGAITEEEYQTQRAEIISKL